MPTPKPFARRWQSMMRELEAAAVLMCPGSGTRSGGVRDRAPKPARTESSRRDHTQTAPAQLRTAEQRPKAVTNSTLQPKRFEQQQRARHAGDAERRSRPEKVSRSSFSCVPRRRRSSRTGCARFEACRLSRQAQPAPAPLLRAVHGSARPPASGRDDQQHIRVLLYRSVGWRRAGCDQQSAQRQREWLLR